MDEIQQLLQEVEHLIENKEYEAADKKLPDAVLEKYNNDELYVNKSNICYYLKQYDRGIEYAEKAIQLDNNYDVGYAMLGFLYNETGDDKKSEEYYNVALNLNPNYVIVHNNLGTQYKNRKDYNKAIEYYKKAIEIDSNFAQAHFNLGLTYEEMGTLVALEKAITSFQKWLQLVKDSNDPVIKYIENKIEELQKQLNDKEYNEVSKIVDEIKSLLKYNGNSITHYTSLSVTRLLILEDKPIRISEAAFLNDTSEGTALFDFLGIDTEHGKNNKKEKDYIPFVKKPFIGSFVADEKCNDLTLWRMYGKENNEEAKGCAITIDAITFLESVKEELLQPSVSGTQSVEDDFHLYNVGYITNDNQFIVPANLPISKTINDKIVEIKKSLKAFVDKNPNQEKKDDMRELLNRIAYLFKNAEYQYEHEVRLIVRDVRLKREIETKDEKKEPLKLPRVFINLININPYISKITIGPKVANKEEWASIFYYHLQEKQANKNLEIQVSCLPFK